MATVTCLQLKTRFFRNLGAYRAVTATSGSASKFTVAALADLTPDCFKGWQLRVTSTITDLRRLKAGPNESGDLEPIRNFSSAISTNTGELWGNSIDGGQELTDLFNEVLKVARPVDMTQITIVTSQEIYDITSTVRSKDDVIAVYRRDLDSASLQPSTDHQVWARAWHVTESGTFKAKLRIYPALTLNATTTELWMRHRKTLTAFTDDTSTVDATYADWLAWRAVLSHVLTMSGGSSDKGRWSDKLKQAAEQVKFWDEAFTPYTAVNQRGGFERPQHG